MLVINKGLQSDSIRLEPNRSANWRQTRSVILGLTGFMLMIGAGWLVMGVWLIFPFVLLDIAIFSYFFYRVCESTYAAEIITVEEDTVKFRSGIRKFGKSVSFKRPCYFIVHPTPSKNHLPIFSISDDFEKTSVGNFLNEEDKMGLKKFLTDCGLIEVNEQWWKREMLVNRNSV
tara:strand:+ start:113 stop:634 length:522 start_codon:yes stop_codon:yes gene_type:complete